MRRGRGWGPASLALALVLAAVAGCTGEPATAPTPSPTAVSPTAETPSPTPTLTPTPTPTEPEDPFAVPDPVTVIYLQRVLQELRRINDEGFRAIVEADGELSEETLAFLDPIRTPEEVEARRRLFEEEAAKGELTPQWREEHGRTPLPEPTAVRMARILEADGDCFWLEAVEDRSASIVGESRDLYMYYALVPKDPAQDPGGVNPTPWAIAYEGRTLDGSKAEPPPESLCP